MLYVTGWDVLFGTSCSMLLFGMSGSQEMSMVLLELSVWFALCECPGLMVAWCKCWCKEGAPPMVLNVFVLVMAEGLLQVDPRPLGVDQGGMD